MLPPYHLLFEYTSLLLLIVSLLGTPIIAEISLFHIESVARNLRSTDSGGDRDCKDLSSS